MKAQRTLGWISLVSVGICTIFALFVVPDERLQGQVGRLLFIHVPIAWAMFLAFFVVFVMSLLYLVQRKLKWDLVAVSAVEVGVLGAALTLVLGSIWAKPTWGVWWEWDPRVTTTAILLIVYIGYLIVRGLSDDPDQRARWAAVIGVISFVQVPIVYMSVFWWRSLHQPPSSPRSMATAFGILMYASFLAYTVAFTYLVMRRYRLAQQELAVEMRGPEDME